MRNVVLGLGISLDGYIARPNGAVDFLFMPKDYSMAPFFATIDTAIMGRKTLDAALQMSGGSFSGSSMATYIFSHSKPAGERDGLVFINQSPATFIRQLRKRPGKDIWLMGGGELARAFLKAVWLMDSTSAFFPSCSVKASRCSRAAFPKRDFTLRENKTYSKGLIALKYTRSRPKSKPKS